MRERGLHLPVVVIHENNTAEVREVLAQWLDCIPRVPTSCDMCYWCWCSVRAEKHQTWWK